ncbi:hypothetical protein [Chitinimonas koreensis]|uniref:hypothetical protein n=1 Tax=Chitinimonas koreensis TaxID=356302 RepID=UPI0012FC0C63|nr:hypothetical protein [Chitinimonas koreensis]QNM97117.1 hypothetical protein H9L41_01930 [Chitinimonas koreensis]
MTSLPPLPDYKDQFRARLIAKICGLPEVEALDAAEEEALFQALADAGQFWRGPFNPPHTPAAQRTEMQRVSESAAALVQAIQQLSQASQIWIDDCLHCVVDLGRLTYEVGQLSKVAQQASSMVSVKQGHRFAVAERLLGMNLADVLRRCRLPLRATPNIDAETDRHGMPILTTPATFASCSALLVLLDAQYGGLSWSAANRMVKYAIGYEKALKKIALPPELLAFAKELARQQRDISARESDLAGRAATLA